MTTGNRVAATSTALQARVMIYQPSQRPRAREGEWLSTPFGRCRVTGRLGQRHADAIEAMLYVAEKRRETADGGIELLVDPAAVRRTMGKTYSHQRLWVLLREAMAAVIEIDTPKQRALGHIIDHVVESQATRPDPLTGGVRSLWRVRLGSLLLLLFEKDLHLRYNPAAIARLQHGVSQAVARHVLTHKHEPSGGWRVDTLLRAVCGESASSQVMRDGRRRLKQDADALGVIGIEITDENRVKRGTAAR